MFLRARYQFTIHVILEFNIYVLLEPYECIKSDEYLFVILTKPYLVLVPNLCWHNRLHGLR